MAEQGKAAPPLTELLSRFLDRRAAAARDGLAPRPPDLVEPFDAVPARPVDPSLAWDEGLEALRLLAPDANLSELRPPPAWPELVAGRESVAAVAFCAGNYPQLLREVTPLLQTPRPSQLARAAGAQCDADTLGDWAAAQSGAGLVLALGVLRLAGDLDAARRFASRHAAAVPQDWRGAWQNELAALAWDAGDADAAANAWRSLPESAPVLFNRGLAALFSDRFADARPLLARAADGLPETGSWHHLARLYLAVAEAHG